MGDREVEDLGESPWLQEVKKRVNESEGHGE